MMQETHPDDLDLLDYVEGDLPADRRPSVEAHLHACGACSDSVRRLEAGRAALRSAPLLQLARERRAGLLNALDARTRERRSPVSPMRLAAVLVPVVVVAVAVSAIVGLGDGGPRGDGAVGETSAQTSGDAGEAAGGATEEDSTRSGGANETATLAGPPVAAVQGPPRAVLDILRMRGFTARVVGRDVVVVGANAEQVARALESRATGSVRVYLG